MSSFINTRIKTFQKYFKINILFLEQICSNGYICALFTGLYIYIIKSLLQSNRPPIQCAVYYNFIED